jgi:energy-converting hydrogenase Eha subunit H
MRHVFSVVHIRGRESFLVMCDAVLNLALHVSALFSEFLLCSFMYCSADLINALFLKNIAAMLFSNTAQYSISDIRKLMKQCVSTWS